MDIATVSVIALVAVVALSCVTNANVGLMAMSLAWLIGAYVAPAFGHAFTAKTVAGWFPVDLFVTLAGVTLLFSIARNNGTLGLVTQAAERLCRSQPRALPPLFFLLATAVSAAGAGNVPTAALLAAPAMLAASRLGLSALVMMLMVGHGAIAGTLSPVSPMGVIADEKLSAMGLPGHEGYTFGMNLLVNAIVVAVGYVALRGWRIDQQAAQAGQAHAAAVGPGVGGRPDWRHLFTLGLLACVIVGAVFLGIHIGLASLAAATLLLLAGAGDERAALKEMPWSVILMVCGMSVLVTLCEKTGGLDIFSRWIAACATPQTLTAWLAGLTGLVSVFSSTSGVVLPTFLPVVPDVLGHLGVEPSPERMLAAATAINVGSNIVDVSSVSTIGALCVAAVPDEITRRTLYRQGLLWGLAMTFVGAAACWAVL
jgi:di/tricarboxylate transporter